MTAPTLPAERSEWIDGVRVTYPADFFDTDVRGYRPTRMMIQSELRINLRKGHHPGMPGYRKIEDLMLESLRHAPTDRKAANTLGLLNSVFSHWLSRLGVTAEADRIRSFRIQ